MPLTRYLIRNEFKLGNPGLYASFDKNDPHAVFEGVAVAGFVGLLKQLGDLAQFAAEVFQSLHEDVMVTAIRSHVLVDRVRKLDADVPSLEKKLLAKNDLDEYYYNFGVDWHLQMSVDENIITQGGLPRFVRKSYEECRAPPQLFLLDKYDVGGDGACLKRFTDPSFFNAQLTTSEKEKLEAQRGCRPREIQNKGSPWRNGEIPTKAPTASRAKLHQLLSEEHNADDSRVLTRHFSLKKKNLEISRSSKSYMQPFLQTMSPEHPSTHEMEVAQGLGSVSEDLIYSSIDQETKPVKSFKYSLDFNNVQRDDDFTSRANGGYTEKELVFTGEKRHTTGVIGSSSDDIAGTTEYYSDAFADVESEVETDNKFRPTKSNEYRGNREPNFCSMSKRGRDQFSNYHSADISNTSDDGSISSVHRTSLSSYHCVPSYDKCGASMEHRDRETELFISSETFEDSDSHSNLILPAVDQSLNVGNYATVSIDVNTRSSLGEISESFDPDMCDEHRTYERYWVDAAASVLRGLNEDYAGPLSAKNRDHDVAYSLTGYQDSEGRVGSNNLSGERNSTNAKYMKGNSYREYEYSPSRYGESGEVSISLSDHQEVESQCSSPVSPSYLVDPNSSCEKNKMEEFSRTQEVIFKQGDQDMKPLNNNHGQVSERVGPAVVIDSTSFRIRDWNSNTKNHIPRSFDASGHIHSSQEWLLHPEEDDQISIPKEYSAANFTSLDISLKQKRREIIFQSDSITRTFGVLPSENEANLEGVPSLPMPPPPVQHSVGKSHDSERDFDKFVMESNMSSPNFTSDLKGSYYNEALGGDEVKNPHAAPTVAIPSVNSCKILFHGNSLPPADDTIDVHGQHIHLASEDSKDQILEDLRTCCKTEHAAQSPEEKIIKCIEVPGPQIENAEHCKQDVNSSKREESWLPNQEEEILIEKPATKLLRPPIKSVDALDRSKLKKVIPRNWIQTPNVESVDDDDLEKSKFKKVMSNVGGRDSILEVIRTKSFNLRPTPASVPKPIIRAPTMSLKVSAILEKANRIRQATTGSDEEDNWSDE